jgi:hypothetical protein
LLHAPLKEQCVQQELILTSVHNDSFKRNELTRRSQASSLQFQAHGDSSLESRESDAKEKISKSVAESTRDSPVEQTSVWEAADEF